MECEYYRKQGHIVYWNDPNMIADCQKVFREPQGLDFLKLPKPDRVFTKAKEYTSGNYKYLPGTHIQAADGCWWGRCVYCVEKGRKYKVRPVDSVIEEIEECKSLGFKEIFDDSGTFPFGNWLNEFCKKKRKIDIPIGCNMRMINLDWKMLKDAGFRMILFGLESASDDSLMRIGKGLLVEHHRHIIDAAKAGLDCHIAVMLGYPWDTKKDIKATLKLTKWLLRKGYAKTAQASLFTLPDRPPRKEFQKYIKGIYGVWKYPDFWYNKIRGVKNKEDIRYLWKGIKTALQ